jgi:hypothetical protein
MTFNLLRHLLVFQLLAMSATFGTAFCSAQQDSDHKTSSPGFASVSVKGVSIAEFDSSHLRIAVALAATANRSVTMETLHITSLRLNGLPVYAEPLSQQIELPQGKETPLPPIYVNAQLRDVTSTQPLKEMIENQMVHVQGDIVADVKINFLDKLAMHTEHPRISVPLTQEVPVTFGSSPFARQAALGVLSILQIGIDGRSIVRKNMPGFESPWIHSLEEQAITDLFAVQSSYELKEHGTTYPVSIDQIGFRLSSGKIITTAEVKDPWDYDPDFLGRIKSHEAKLIKNRTEISLRSTGKQLANTSPLLLSNQDFSLEITGNSEKEPLILPKGSSRSLDGQPDQMDDFAKVNVLRRASPAAMAVITLHSAMPGTGFHAAPARIVEQDHWEKVALFRLEFDPKSRKPSVEVIQMSARRDGLAIHLDQPVDPSFYGSPIITPEGVLGVVQDQQTGAFLPPDLANAALANAEESAQTADSSDAAVPAENALANLLYSDSLEHR